MLGMHSSTSSWCQCRTMRGRCQEPMYNNSCQTSLRTGRITLTISMRPIMFIKDRNVIEQRTMPAGVPSSVVTARLRLTLRGIFLLTASMASGDDPTRISNARHASSNITRSSLASGCVSFRLYTRSRDRFRPHQHQTYDAHVRNIQQEHPKQGICLQAQQNCSATSCTHSKPHCIVECTNYTAPRQCRLVCSTQKVVE